jgi:hypothetical protein
MIEFTDDVAAQEFIMIEEALATHPQDGLVWDGHYVSVWRENGRTIMQGKPIRVPMRYSVVPEGV